MRQLVNEYSNLNQAGSNLEYMKQLVSELPWGHNILIIQKVKDIKARVFYLQTAIKNRYESCVYSTQQI
jgi:predicted nuclease of restriction endonuclease-like (RecB) superfamily